VNDHDYTSLFSSLNAAVEILHRNRKPDPAFVAAFDTLRQSRAMLVNVLNKPADGQPATSTELAAA
jgi:hypothetical protein